MLTAIYTLYSQPIMEIPFVPFAVFTFIQECATNSFPDYPAILHAVCCLCVVCVLSVCCLCVV